MKTFIDVETLIREEGGGFILVAQVRFVHDTIIRRMSEIKSKVFDTREEASELMPTFNSTIKNNMKKVSSKNELNFFERGKDVNK